VELDTNQAIKIIVEEIPALKGSEKSEKSINKRICCYHGF
jgi:hypothetical protein